MNKLVWLRVKKVKVEYCRDETWCLQFFLHNRSIQGIFINNGEFEKKLSLTEKKNRIQDFKHYPPFLLRDIARNN